MSAVIIVLSVMIVPILVGDRTGGRCSSPPPPLSQSVAVPTEQEGARTRAHPRSPHPTPGSLQDIAWSAPASHVSPARAAQQSKGGRGGSSSSQSLIEGPSPAISGREPGKEATFPQPISFPTAILIPTSMSPGLSSVYFECTVAF